MKLKTNVKNKLMFVTAGMLALMPAIARAEGESTSVSDMIMTGVDAAIVAGSGIMIALAGILLTRMVVRVIKKAFGSVG